MNGPPVTVAVVCPACDGARCKVCNQLGVCVARLVDDDETADTDPAPPPDNEETD